jgi:hypothetical protein
MDCDGIIGPNVSAITHEITTTPHYDRQVTEVMTTHGVSRSEAYRILLGRAAGREPGRQRLGQLLATIKNEALSLQRESSLAAPRAREIVRCAAEAMGVM